MDHVNRLDHVLELPWSGFVKYKCFSVAVFPKLLCCDFCKQNTVQIQRRVRWRKFRVKCICVCSAPLLGSDPHVGNHWPNQGIWKSVMSLILPDSKRLQTQIKHRVIVGSGGSVSRPTGPFISIAACVWMSAAGAVSPWTTSSSLLKAPCQPSSTLLT